MADRPTVTTLSSGALYDTDTLNSNFTGLRDAFDNVLGLNGTTGDNNTITGDVDWANNIARNIVLDDPTSTVSTLPDGSVGAPAFSFTDDTDTGMYRPTTNTLAFSGGGADSLRILPISSGVNYVTVKGGTGTTGGIFGTAGTQDNLDFFFQTKGTGSIFFQTSTNKTQLKVANVTTAAEYLTFYGAAADGSPQIATEGAGSNLDLTLTLKGSGGVIVGAATGGGQGTDTINCSGIFIDGVAVGSGLPRSYLAGMGMTNGTDASHDINFAAGSCTDVTNAVDIVETALIKQIDATWAVGTNQGGLDSAPAASNTWYHCYAIRRSDTGVTDFLFSADADTPAMPTNYDNKRRIGAVLTDNSSNIIGFTQTGDFFQWDDPTLDINTTTQSTSAINYAIAAPLGIKTVARMQFQLDVGNAAEVYLTSGDADDEAPADGTAPLATGRGSQHPYPQVDIMTNTASQIRGRATASSTPIDGVTLGYTDFRGRND